MNEYYSNLLPYNLLLSLNQPWKQLMGLEQKRGKEKTISTSGIWYVVAIMCIIAFVLSTYVL